MADIVTSRQFTDGERGITAQKLNDIVGSSTIQPAFYSSKPTASSADPTDIALILKAGAYAQVPISSLAGSATQAQIWDTRLRSYNAIGNPNFEVTQRNVGRVITNPVNGSMLEDRWAMTRVGATMAVTARSIPGATPSVPGTNFRISNNILRITITTQQASLATGDALSIFQNVEGSLMRELIGDVHSMSLLVRSSVAPLSFAIALRDSGPTTQSLVKLCTIPTANVYALITLPNIPVFPAGNFSLNPGAVGYSLSIVLSAGTTLTASAADTWQTGNFIGAPGMNNFAASPVNSTFDIAFVQHEPGPLCTTLMDKPFAQNLDECLRYYQKTAPYGTPYPGPADGNGQLSSVTLAGQGIYGCFRFSKPMAKTPTMTYYSPVTGTGNAVYDLYVPTDRGINSIIGLSDKGYSGMVLGNQNANLSIYTWHHIADTGW